MAYARYQDEVGSVLRATLHAPNLVVVTPSYQSAQALVQVGVEFCGGTATIEPYDYYTWAYTLPYDISGESWPQAAQDAFTAWADALPTAQSADSMAIGYLFRARATVGGVTSDLYLCTGVAERFHPGHIPAKYFEPYGASSWDLNATWTLKNVYVKGQTSDAPSIYRQSPRRWTDRTLSCRLFADGQSQLELTLGAASATDDLAWADEEVLIGGSAGAVTTSITVQTVPTLNTSFGNVSGITLGDGSITFSHREFDDYTTDGSTWTRTATGAKFHAAVGAAGVHDLQMVATGVSGSVSHGATSEIVGPIRFQIDTGRYGPDSDFEYDGAPSFLTGVREYQTDESTEELVIAPDTLTDWIVDVGTVSSAGVVARTSGYSIPSSIYCKALDSWYDDTARHENVGVTTDEVFITALDDQSAYLLAHPLNSALDPSGGYKWFTGLLLTRQDVTLDKPPGYSARPTSWAAAGTNVTVTGTGGDTWTVAGAGAAVARTLATRFWLRMERMAAKLAATENLDPDWPIQLTANEHLTNDDASWATAFPVEDVTNWDNGRMVQLKFDTWPAGAEDETVTLTVNYSTVIIEDPCYTCHEHRFGALGTWQYERTTALEVFSGVLTASGTVLFDLGLMPRDKARCLQHVDRIRIALPAVAGEYVLDSSHGLDLIADPSTHGYDSEAYPRLMVNPAIDPWNWDADYSGFADSYEGVMGLNLVYGYEDKERVMRGMKQTQRRQHCPSNTLQDDINFAKVLSRLADELSWQEGITCTYDSASVNAALTDEDDVTLTGLYWWDLRRDSGEYAPGTSDAITVGPRVAYWSDLAYIPFVPVTIYCGYPTQGVAHGMAYAGGEVSRGGGGSSDTTTAYDYQLVYLDGATWVPCGSFEPDPSGRWVTPPGPEKDRIYGVKPPTGSVISLGEFANRELAIQTLASVLRYCRNPFIRRAFTGGVYLVAQSGLAATGDILGYYHGAQEACQWQQFAAKPLTGDYRNPTISEGDDGSLLVSATNTATGALDFALSRDGGRTWEAV